MARRSGTSGRSGIANILAFALFLLAIAVGLVFATLLLQPDLLPRTPTLTPTRTAVPPTLAVAALVPTVTPTATDDPLLRPTFTPIARATRVDQQPLGTQMATLTPSITPTIPTKTPTPTPSNTPTPTDTPGPSPTPTFTLSPFPFTKSPDSPIYLRNFANTAGCDWLGLAGEVLDTNGLPVGAGAYRVHIWESGIDTRLDTGSAPAYGPSGWEQFVLNKPAIRDYNVQLETKNGTAVSQVYRVQTRASCNENLLYLIFLQNR